jgi:hypothetical protein
MQKWILVAALIVALFSSYGYFYGGPVHGNYHVILERSLEYRNDLKLNQHVAKIIEDKYAGYKVVAPFIIAQLLALPELGYVQKNLDVIIYGFQCQYGGIETYPGLVRLNTGKIIYVATQVGRDTPAFLDPIHPKDKIIREVQYGNKKSWLFMGGVGIESVFRAVQIMRLKGN